VALAALITASSANAGTAIVQFGGDLEFGPASQLTLEIGEPIAGFGYDQLQVAGDADLGGALVLDPSETFEPPLGATYTALTCAARSGEFASVAGVQQTGERDLALLYSGDAVAIEVRRRGDVDGDGQLTASDTAIVQAAATAGLVSTNYAAGDVDGSGLVDASDVTTVEDAVASSAPIPALHPIALLALVGGLLAILLARSARGFALALTLLLARPAAADLLDPMAFAALGVFDTSAGGSYTIDTDALTITNDAAPGTPLFVGVIDDQGGLADSFGPGGAVTTVGPAGIPHIAVFTFSALDLDASSSFTITGHRALALLSQGNATIDTVLRLNGAPGSVSSSVNPFTTPTIKPALRGGPGGFDGGGSAGPGSPQSGLGPSGGGASQVNTNVDLILSAGSGAHQNAGPDGQCSPPSACGSAVVGSSGTPGTDSIADLLRGGSGGGASQVVYATITQLTSGGSGGGGAIELGAVGLLTLGGSSQIDASAVAPSPVRNNQLITTTGNGILVQGGLSAGGAVRIHAGRLINNGSANVSARGRHVADGVTYAGGAILLRGFDSELVIGQAITPDQFGALPGNGVFSLQITSTRVLAGETLELSGASVVQAQTATLPRIELALENIEIADGATGSVPAGGFTNDFDLRLMGLDAVISGSGLLTNAGVLRGTGLVVPAVLNSATGRVSIVGESLGFASSLTNAVDGRISIVSGTLVVPGDGLANDDGLVNNGTLNLIDATVDGDVRSPTGSTINVAGSAVFNGLVSGGASFSGTQNQIVFKGGYSPGD
jgi:hypothetical protein